MAEYTCPGCGIPIESGICSRCKKRIKLGINAEKVLRYNPELLSVPIETFLDNPSEGARCLLKLFQEWLKVGV
jgi:hypothetical protein